MAHELTVTEVVILNGFSKPRLRQDVAGYSLWRDPSVACGSSSQGGDKAHKVLERIQELVDKGLLRRPSPSERLGVMTLPELREALERIGARTSGRKSVLIERLCQELPPGQLDGVVAGDFLIISASGIQTIEDAVTRDEQRHRDARARSFDAIARGDLESGIREFELFMDGRMIHRRHLPFCFQRVNANFDFRPLYVLEHASVPSLASLESGDLMALRKAVIFATLWGDDAIECSGIDLSSGTLSPEVAAAHLRSGAALARSRGSDLLAGRLVRSTPESPLCGQCDSLDGARVERDEPLPSLPAVGCNSEFGCPLRFAADQGDRSGEFMGSVTIEVDLQTGESTFRSAEG